MERVFRAADGTRVLEQIAIRSGANLQSTKKALDALSEIGAVKTR